MTSSGDLLATVVALARRVGLDSPRLAEEIEQLGPNEVLSRTLETPTSLFPPDPTPLLERARADLADWAARGVRTLSVLDPAYPDNLRAVHDRPALLFAAGELTDGDRRAIAVVGSRAPTDARLELARTIARDLVTTGHIVVSGLAAGIDTAAHTAAHQHHGRTIAVIGTGLDHAYPPQNEDLQRELARSHAVLSPFWPDTPAGAEGFRRRNAVMSALARGTVIVAAGPRSGTRIQARRALAHARPVFLVADLLSQPWAVELAARPNVHVVETAAEVTLITDRLAEPLSDG